MHFWKGIFAFSLQGLSYICRSHLKVSYTLRCVQTSQVKTLHASTHPIPDSHGSCDIHFEYVGSQSASWEHLIDGSGCSARRGKVIDDRDDSSHTFLGVHPENGTKSAVMNGFIPWSLMGCWSQNVTGFCCWQKASSYLGWSHLFITKCKQIQFSKIVCLLISYR